MTLRVARIPYLNSVPFYQGLERPEFEFVDLSPRPLGKAAAAVGSDVSAGILSMCDLFRTPGFEPLGALGVACDGPSHSVLLFCRTHPQELGDAAIAITGETSTSYPLLRLLLEEHFGVRACTYHRRDQPEPTDDAVLWIGDRALRAAAAHGLRPGEADYTPGLVPLPAAGDSTWRYALDLASVWRKWQQLPFVFARWAVATTAPAAERADLLEALVGSLDQSLRDLRSLAAAEAASSAYAAMSADAIYAYWMGFTYRLGAPELAGIDRFHQLLSGTPWWGHARPRWMGRTRA